MILWKIILILEDKDMITKIVIGVLIVAIVLAIAKNYSDKLDKYYYEEKFKERDY